VKTLFINNTNGFQHFSLFEQIFAVQHVDVCMFSNGKFKNTVAEVDMSKQIGPGETLHGVYSLLPIRGKGIVWQVFNFRNEDFEIYKR
jgi:hypothetical protein